MDLYERSLRYLIISKTALDNSFYDVSSTNCAISAELMIRSVYSLLRKDPPYYSFHHIRKILSSLSFHIPSFEGEITRLIRENRKEFVIVESSRNLGQYSDITKENAEICINTVENKLLPLIKRIRENILNQ
ncbi:HEPN domain-containing protein [Acidianus manzaensis]|uniref:HEPN domain-containing protein n=1 Tax=Acidianus manzaensis TaxID=282676 RepID=A0A1W6K2U0_9CREN|nr:HEPN domain-containing protein [Acidianus manzaensis]ARM76839.1 hypothetical protein B6F84_12960 [Acidianus manzaensis]